MIVSCIEHAKEMNVLCYCLYPYSISYCYATELVSWIIRERFYSSLFVKIVP